MRVSNPFSGWDRGDALVFGGLSLLGYGLYLWFGLGPSLTTLGVILMAGGILAILYKPKGT